MRSLKCANNQCHLPTSLGPASRRLLRFGAERLLFLLPELVLLLDDLHQFGRGEARLADPVGQGGKLTIDEIVTEEVDGAGYVLRKFLAGKTFRDRFGDQAANRAFLELGEESRHSVPTV